MLTSLALEKVTAFSFETEKKTTHELVVVVHTVIILTAKSEKLLRDTKGFF